MEIEEKIYELEDAGFDYFKIAKLLHISYEEVRQVSEHRKLESKSNSKHLKEILKVVLFDLGCIPIKNKDDNYHMKLAIGNIKDVIKNMRGD